MSKQPKSERIPLWRRMRDGYDRATGKACRAELAGCGMLTMQGCERILEYGCCCIRLAVRDPDMCEVIVCGEQLLCLSYHPDAVQVQGQIHSVRFIRNDMKARSEDV